MTERTRPLSPHLQVYRLPLTAIISITHRATGIFLAMGMLILVACLLAIAGGADAFASMQSMLGSLIGRLFIFGWTFALFFHLCHGIRHLVWDVGAGFDRADMDRLALFEIAASVVITLFIWIVAFAVS